MEEEIIDKLKSALSEPIEKEKDVVYILTEIRKLLERNDIKSKYSILNFYCNWVLHSVIDRVEPEIHKLLQEIETTIRSGKFDTAIPKKMLNFELFQKDFQKFISDFSINYNLQANWITFRKLLIDIISDCPLEIKQGSVEGFNFIHSKDYKDAECEITFRSGSPKKFSIGVHFQNY
jgi:hypothetical protein